MISGKDLKQSAVRRLRMADIKLPARLQPGQSNLVLV